MCDEPRQDWRWWRLIGRHEAEDKLREFYEAEGAKLELMAQQCFCPPDYERLRNYEIEWELHEIFGGEWCVNSICPFNGVYCRLSDTPHGAELRALCETGWEKAGGSCRAVIEDFEARGLIATWNCPREEQVSHG